MKELMEGSRVLIAYFSRWGNTDYPEGIDAGTSASIVADKNGRYGTTEYMANMIQNVTGGDLYLIQTGKTVIPFCSHGTGGVGRSIRDLKEAVPHGEFLEEIGIYRQDTEEARPEIQKWVRELDVTK